jgi:hypothetical protein
MNTRGTRIDLGVDVVVDGTLGDGLGHAIPSTFTRSRTRVTTLHQAQNLPSRVRMAKGLGHVVSNVGAVISVASHGGSNIRATHRECVGSID